MMLHRFPFWKTLEHVNLVIMAKTIGLDFQDRLPSTVINSRGKRGDRSVNFGIEMKDLRTILRSQDGFQNILFFKAGN